MKVVIEFDSVADREVLAKLFCTGNTQVLEPAGEVEKKATEPAVSEKKPRSPRREQKEEAAVEQVEATVASSDAPVAEAASEQTEVAVPLYTLSDIREALQAYTSANSLEAGITLLRSFGAGRISELKEEDFAAFIAKAKV